MLWAEDFPFLVDGFFAGTHGEDGLPHQLLNGPTQSLGTLTDHIPGAAGGEFLILELLS